MTAHRKVDRLVESQERSLNCLIAIELRLKALERLVEVADYIVGIDVRCAAAVPGKRK
jgi:hypothetical protein